jgi:hypothetical protein
VGENLFQSKTSPRVLSVLAVALQPMVLWESGSGIQQLDSTRQIGPETTLQSIPIVVEKGGKGGRIKAAAPIHTQPPPSGKFSPQSVLAIPPQPNGAMGKWILQLDSAHQIGPLPSRAF